jgi:hypothetical protein
MLSHGFDRRRSKEGSTNLTNDTNRSRPGFARVPGGPDVFVWFVWFVDKSYSRAFAASTTASTVMPKDL